MDLGRDPALDRTLLRSFGLGSRRPTILPMGLPDPWGASPPPQHGSFEEDPRPLFQSDSGLTWDSHYYREEFVYPLLHRLQMEGDPLLLPLRDRAGLVAAYKSLHMYRRGGNSHVEVVRSTAAGGLRVGLAAFRRRKATKEEQCEHARWSLKRANLPLHVMYREWSLWDRLQITIFCM